MPALALEGWRESLDRRREQFVVVMRDGTELTSSRTYSGALREMLEL